MWQVIIKTSITLTRQSSCVRYITRLQCNIADLKVHDRFFAPNHGHAYIIRSRSRLIYAWFQFHNWKRLLLHRVHPWLQTQTSACICEAILRKALDGRISATCRFLRKHLHMYARWKVHGQLPWYPWHSRKYSCVITLIEHCHQERTTSVVFNID